MSKKIERQLSFLLPISNNRTMNGKPRVAESTGLNAARNDEKAYLKIRQSLKSKGLVKPR